MTARKPGRVVPPLYLVLGVMVLATAWLQPNHYLPWSAFHAEIAAAVALLGLALVVTLRVSGQVAWHGSAVFGVTLVALPVIQWAFGLIASPGHAFINALSTGGFAFAMLLAARWENAGAGEVADGLFLAIGIAAILSVGLQFHQWLEFDWLFMSSMGGGSSRPAANIGQANLLGTLLLWAIIGGAWGVVRGHMQVRVFALYAGFLVLGIALTESRAAVLNAFLLVGASWFWRKSWPSPKAPRLAAALFLLLLLLMYAAPFVRGLLFSGSDIDARMLSGTSIGLRFRAYEIFMDAIAQRPWAGYGWGQAILAHAEVAERHEAIGSMFGNAHNVLLDLLVWAGIPIGLAIFGAICLWFFKCLRTVRESRDIVLVMVLGVFGVHSMLEFPYEYGYFLWPVGAIVGVLNVRLGFKQRLLGSRYWLAALWAAFLVLTIGVALDYMKVEENYRAWRFEAARVGSGIREPVPDLMLLSQMDSLLWALRVEVHENMTEAEIAKLKDAVVALPNLATVFYYSKALAMNGKPEEARTWQRRSEKMFSGGTLAIARADWTRQAISNPKMAAVPWSK